MIKHNNSRKRLNRDVINIVILILILVLIIIIAGIVRPAFLTTKHILSITHDSSILGLASIGQTLVILTGGIDLSLGSTMLIVDAVGAKLFGGENILYPLFICLSIGILIGTINGLGIAFLKIPPFIMTLGTMIITTGAVFIYTPTPSGFAAPVLRYLSTSEVKNIPILILIWLFLSIIMFIILKLTVYGRKIYAVGGNPLASFRSGLKNKIIIFSVYLISSIIATIAGLFLLGYTGTPYLSYKGGLGTDYTLLSIASVLLGGTFFIGAKGGIERTIIGVLILKFIFSLLIMMGMGEQVRLIVQGVIIVFIVGIYTRLEKMRY